MLIKNFAEVREAIKPHLVDYLESKGIETAKNFKCLDPKHEDKNPSCSMLPDKLGAYCHSCSRAFDIFDAVALFENKQLFGYSFVEIIQTLAAQYNIPIEMGEVSEEKMFEFMVYRAYRDVADYIVNCKLSILASKEADRRGWKNSTLRETLTGTVDSFENLHSYLINKGYDDQFLKDADLGREDIFNPECLIFTTCDEHGNPVGFAARRLTWKKGDSVSKYVNQRTTGIKANIYQKGKRLYGFHLARQENKPIYIFEGQGDVLTARQAGLTNCVAIGSTGLSTDHIMVLKEYDKYNIILALDGDRAGVDKIIKLLDTRFAGHKDMKVSVILIPDNMDPDEFIRTRGLDEFHKLAKRSAFEWRLQSFNQTEDPQLICSAMIPYIVNESSFLIQEDMAKILSGMTGYSPKAITAEVQRLQNAHEEKKSLQRINLVEQALRDAKENPQDAEIILTETKNRLFQISRQYNDDTMSEAEFLDQVISQKTTEESKSGKFSGFVLSEDMKYFQSVLAGEWDKDVLIVIGGNANSGKSALVCKLAYDIASMADNEALSIIHTIDDSRAQILPRLVAIAEGSKTLQLNQIKDPNYWGKQDSSVPQKRINGYGKLENLIKNGRLIVKDNNHGNTIAYIETLIQYYKERYPNRKLVYFLDNFHKLSDYSEMKDERTRFARLSNAIKAIAVQYHIPVISTMEYTKLPKGTRPGNNNIAESVRMEYDSNAIIHLYNEMHELGPECNIYHTVSSNGKIQKLPRVEVIFGKNKITSFKDSIFMDFFPASSDFRGISMDEVAIQLAQAKQQKDAKLHNKGHGDPNDISSIV